MNYVLLGLHLRHFCKNISSVIQLNRGLKNKAAKLKTCKINIINSSIRKQLLMQLFLQRINCLFNQIIDRSMILHFYFSSRVFVLRIENSSTAKYFKQNLVDGRRLLGRQAVLSKSVPKLILPCAKALQFQYNVAQSESEL